MIKEIIYDEIPKEIIKEAKRHLITFINDAKYYGYFIDNKIIGISAIKKYKKVSILKSSYVIPEYRKRGIYKKMVHHRIKIIDNKIIETNAKKEACIYLLKIGFKIIKEYKIATKLRYEKTHSNT